MTKEPFIKLIEMQSVERDLEFSHKLTMKHILVAGIERQNFRKAAELFSITIGKSISYNFPQFNHVEEVVQNVKYGLMLSNLEFSFVQLIFRKVHTVILLINITKNKNYIVLLTP